MGVSGIFGYSGTFDEYLGNGKVLKRWWKEYLIGKNLSFYTTPFSRYDNGIALRPRLSKKTIGYSEGIFIKYNGLPIKSGGNMDTDSELMNSSYADNISYIYHFMDNDTAQSSMGLNTSFTPSINHIKAFYNGWKINGYDGNGNPNSWIGLDSAGTVPTINTLDYVAKTTLLDQNPNTDWRPYTVIYQLAEPEIVDVSMEEDTFVIEEGVNYITNGNNLPLAMEIDIYNTPQGFAGFIEKLKSYQNIVDKGQNKNGYYVKFSDGTMIQWGEKWVDTTGFSIADNNVGSYGWSYWYKEVSGGVVFPIEFVDTNIRVVGNCSYPGYSGGVFYVNFTEPHTTYIRTHIHHSVNPGDYNTALIIRWFAIGRWK